MTQAVSLPHCCHTAKAAASQPPPTHGKFTWEAWLFERAPHPEAQAGGELQRDGGPRCGGVWTCGLLHGPLGLSPHPALSSTHCQTKRGVRAADGGWTPGWTRHGDWGCRPPARCPKPFHLPPNPHPRALVVHVADCGPAHSPSGRAGAGCPPTNTAPAGTHFRALAIVLTPIPTRGHSPCHVQAGLSFPARGSGPLALGASTGSRGHSRDRRAPSSVPGSLGGSGWHPTVPLCLKGPTPGLESVGHYVTCQWPTGPGT